jgi:hypothetical protein
MKDYDMKRVQLIGVLACGLLVGLLPTLWAQNPADQTSTKSLAWEYRVVLVADLQSIRDENKDGVNDVGPVEMAQYLNQKIKELGKERWEFVLEHNGWLDYWLFRRPINN